MVWLTVGKMEVNYEVRRIKIRFEDSVAKKTSSGVTLWQKPPRVSEVELAEYKIC